MLRGCTMMTTDIRPFFWLFTKVFTSRESSVGHKGGAAVGHALFRGNCRAC